MVTLRWFGYAGAVVALSLSGCASGGQGEVDVGVTSQPLTVVPSASGGGGSGSGGSAAGDASSPRLQITVTDVEVHVAGDGTDAATHGNADAKGVDASGADGSGSSGWVSVFSGHERVDLLDAAQTEALLGSASVPVGKITQIRLILADDAALVDGGNETKVSCPSCTQTGLKLVTEGKLEVADGDTLHVALDFDPDHSLSSDGQGGWVLKPVIKAVAK